jgi:hypothetical protein
MFQSIQDFENYQVTNKYPIFLKSLVARIHTNHNEYLIKKIIHFQFFQLLLNLFTDFHRIIL